VTSNHLPTQDATTNLTIAIRAMERRCGSNFREFGTLGNDDQKSLRDAMVSQEPIRRSRAQPTAADGFPVFVNRRR
jgi:hypothetical protein